MESVDGNSPSQQAFKDDFESLMSHPVSSSRPRLHIIIIRRLPALLYTNCWLCLCVAGDVLPRPSFAALERRWSVRASEALHFHFTSLHAVLLHFTSPYRDSTRLGSTVSIVLLTQKRAGPLALAMAMSSRSQTRSFFVIVNQLPQ